MKKVFLLLLLASLSRGAAALALSGPNDKLIEKVRIAEGQLKRVLLIGHLQGQLLAEAKQALLVADNAFDGSVGGDAAKLQIALQSFQAFSKHLDERASALRGGAAGAKGGAAVRGSAASSHSEEIEAKAKELLPRLASNAQRVLKHLEADVDVTHAEERATIVGNLKSALADESGSVPDRVLKLHDALSSAQGLLAKRTAELGAEEARLRAETEEAQTSELLRLLKQRRNLPMPTQVAVLKRQQFSEDAEAKKLIQSHSESVSLYDQLLAALPAGSKAAVAEHATAAKQHDGAGAGGIAAQKDHLAAGGSEGRVHIVSSRLKNTVAGMVTMLRGARAKLATIAQGTSAEASQAKEILSGLDNVLDTVGKTNDLQKQLDAMDEVEHKLLGWMKTAAHPAQAH